MIAASPQNNVPPAKSAPADAEIPCCRPSVVAWVATSVRSSCGPTSSLLLTSDICFDSSSKRLFQASAVCSASRRVLIVSPRSDKEPRNSFCLTKPSFTVCSNLSNAVRLSFASMRIHSFWASTAASRRLISDSNKTFKLLILLSNRSFSSSDMVARLSVLGVL